MRIYVIEMNCKEYQELQGLQGLQELQGLQKCPKCHGTGTKQKIKLDPNKKDGSVICNVSDCPVCHGSGFVKKEK